MSYTHKSFHLCTVLHITFIVLMLNPCLLFWQLERNWRRAASTMWSPLQWRHRRDRCSAQIGRAGLKFPKLNWKIIWYLYTFDWGPWIGLVAVKGWGFLWKRGSVVGGRGEPKRSGGLTNHGKPREANRGRDWGLTREKRRSNPGNWANRGWSWVLRWNPGWQQSSCCSVGTGPVLGTYWCTIVHDFFGIVPNWVDPPLNLERYVRIFQNFFEVSNLSKIWRKILPLAILALILDTFNSWIFECLPRFSCQ